MKGGQSAPGLEKDLLGDVGGVLRVAQQAQGLAVDLLFIPLHQLAEGRLVAALCQRQQRLLIHAGHLLSRGVISGAQHRSRRTPFVTAAKSAAVSILQICSFQ